jgi:hypothetical protein
MDRVCGTYRENRNAYSVLVGKPERKAPLEDLGLVGRLY